MPDFSSLEAAAAALNALTAQEAAEKARIDAAVQAALQATISPARTFYLDAVAGLDTNDGTTAVRAVQTPQQALRLVGAGQSALIVMCSDITLTAGMAIDSIISFVSDTATANAALAVKRRTFTVAPSAWNGLSYPIGVSLMRFLGFYNVDLHIGPLVNCNSVIGSDRLMFSDCAITFDPGMTGTTLISSNIPADIAFIGSTSLPSDYAGKLFFGVPAGANPNTTMRRTSLISA